MVNNLLHSLGTIWLFCHIKDLSSCQRRVSIHVDIEIVATKTTNHPKSPEIIRNHPKRSTASQSYPPQTIRNPTTQNHPS